MRYSLYLKSHCEAPDYEDDCDAKDKNEAINIFLKRMNKNSEELWTKEMIENQIASEKELEPSLVVKNIKK